MVLARSDLPAHHPQNVPLSQWSDGWLKLSCAKDATYLLMHDDEKRKAGLPVTRDEMIDYIVADGGTPAAGV